MTTQVHVRTTAWNNQLQPAVLVMSLMKGFSFATTINVEQQHVYMECPMELAPVAAHFINQGFHSVGGEKKHARDLSTKLRCGVRLLALPSYSMRCLFCSKR